MRAALTCGTPDISSAACNTILFAFEPLLIPHSVIWRGTASCHQQVRGLRQCGRPLTARRAAVSAARPRPQSDMPAPLLLAASGASCWPAVRTPVILTLLPAGSSSIRYQAHDQRAALAIGRLLLHVAPWFQRRFWYSFCLKIPTLAQVLRSERQVVHRPGGTSSSLLPPLRVVAASSLPAFGHSAPKRAAY